MRPEKFPNFSGYKVLKTAVVLIALFLPFVSFSQINQALTAKASQSDGRAAPYDAGNYNDGTIAAPGSTPWGWLSASNTSGTSAWILYEWSKSVPINEIYFYNVLTTTRCMIGCDVQYWDGSAWKTAGTYASKVPEIEGSIKFNTVSTTKLRLTNFTIGGSQTSNPNWREIQAWYHSYGPNDVGVSAIDSPSAFCPGSYNLVVSVSNFGINQVDTLTLNWMLDGVKQTPVNFYNLLDTAGGKGSTSAQINLGKLTFTKARKIKAWTSNPNNIKDTVNLNDTLEATLKPSLSGTFTIGPKGDYTKFADAIDDLNQFGVCGPVKLLVRPGTYAGGFELKEIAGASATNTITFEAKHADSVTVTLTGSSTSNMNTITLNGCDWVTFRNLTVETKGSTYGIAYMITNKSSHNRIVGNKIKANTSSTSAYTNGIIFSGAVTSYSTYGDCGDYNLIDSNNFIGGYYGIRMVGSTSTAPTHGNKIIGNVFTEQYYYGVYSYYNDSVQLIGNHVSKSRYTYNYGYMMYYMSNYIMERNYAENFYYSALYYANYYNWNGKTQSICKNNIIISTGTSYGMYAYRMGKTNFYHNSISSQGSYLMYLYYGDNNDIRNNIFTYGGSTYMIYTTNSTFIDFDYNDFYLTGSGTVAYNNGTVCSNLSAFQSASQTNAHSWDLNPAFVSTSDLHLSKSFPGMYGVDVGVVKDHDGDPRCTFSPTIGADEFPQTVIPPTANFLAADTLWFNSSSTIWNSNKPGGAMNSRWYVNGKFMSDSLHLVYTPNTVGYDTISLAMQNCGGTDSIAKAVYVSPVLRKPTADFSASSRNIYTGDVIRLDDISQNGPSQWTWSISPVMVYDPFLATTARAFNYIGKADSTSAHPVLSFDYPGVYEVCLKVANSRGADSLCRSSYIIVREKFLSCQLPEYSTSTAGTLFDDGGPDGFYSPNKTGLNTCFNSISTCKGELALTFREFDLASGDYLRIYDGDSKGGKPLWDMNAYPDGITGKKGDAGVPAKLTALSGSAYFEFESDNNAATTAAGYAIDWDLVPTTFTKPTADIDMPDTACVGIPVYFRNATSGVYSDVEWDLDNDGKVEGYNEVLQHTYNVTGSYTVRLDANGYCAGSDSIIKTIVIIDAAKSPVPAYYTSSRVVYAGDTVEFNDMSQYCSSSTLWAISPANYVLDNGSALNDNNIRVIFTKSGFYDISLSKTNTFGTSTRTDSAFIQVLDYCAPYTIQTNSDIGISRVKFNTIDHKSKAGVDAYSNFTKAFQTTVEIGLTYGITIERETNLNAMSRKVWIDYNIDGDFDDAGELVLSESPSSSLSFTDSITIPATAKAGTTRLRVGVSYKNQSNTACGPNQIGEYEDYGVVISPDDKTKPTLKLTGAISDTIEVYSSWTEPGYFSFDKRDGNLTSKVQVSSNLDTTEVGVYTVTYTIADAASNVNSKSRTIYVMDRTLPQVSLLGDTSVFIEIFNSYTELGALYSDNYDTSLQLLISGNLDTANIGTYSIDYCVTDQEGNGPVCQTRTVVVGDTTNPIISLKGDQKVVIDVHSFYSDSGYVVTDNNPSSVVVSQLGTWNADPSVLGDYTLIYQAMDYSGNSASVTRDISVVDRESPIISLKGNSIDTIFRWSTYNDAGYTLSDNYYDSAEMTVTMGGNFVNTLSSGIYYISYQVEDPSGNKSEEVNRVIVVQQPIGIEESNGISIRTYPNPASGMLYISVELDRAATHKIQILNALGQVVIPVSMNLSASTAIGQDISNLSAGIYFVQVVTEKGQMVQKVEISH